MVKKYNFLANVYKHIEGIDNEKKKVAIGLIISSLQRPHKEVLQAICEKQKKDVDELYKSLGWKK
jgi:hypothetical protein